MNASYQVNKMASGNLSLAISENVSWESFPARADAFLQRVGGLVTHKAENALERVWKVTIHGQQFWLAYDDYTGMSLDSTSSLCNEIVLTLRNQFLAE